MCGGDGGGSVMSSGSEPDSPRWRGYSGSGTRPLTLSPGSTLKAMMAELYPPSSHVWEC